MRESRFEIAARDRRARGVLIEDVGEDVELEGLERDGMRLPEAPSLVEREIELAQEHRVRRAIDATRIRETATRVHCAGARRARGHRLTQTILRARPFRARCGHEKNVARTLFPGQKPRITVLRVYAVSRHGILVLFALSLLACGRKATREDCEMVVDKNIEAKLKADGVSDPAVVQKRKDELKPGLKEDIDKCVGRRVTDGMMKCVRAAETTEQIDKCLR